MLGISSLINSMLSTRQSNFPWHFLRKRNWSSLIRFLSSCAFERCLPMKKIKAEVDTTLCRLLLLFSSFYMWSRLGHYWSNVHQRDHRSGCLLKCLPIAEYLCSAMCGNASVKMSGCITTFVKELSWYVSLMAHMTKTGRVYERGRALNNEDGESLRARKSLK